MDVQELRERAGNMLSRSLNLMNNEGAHWTQNAFHREYSSGHVYCMMGGLGKIRNDDIVSGLDKDATQAVMSFWGYDPEEEDEDIEVWKNEYVETRDMGQRMIDSPYAELQLTPEQKQNIQDAQDVFNASEVALAWATWKVAVVRAETGNREYLSQVTNRNVETMQDDKTTYTFLPLERPDTSIVTFNDYSQTSWADVVEAHEVAIAGLKDGSAPTDWTEAGKLLVDIVPESQKVHEHDFSNTES